MWVAKVTADPLLGALREAPFQDGYPLRHFQFAVGGRVCVQRLDQHMFMGTDKNIPAAR